MVIMYLDRIRLKTPIIKKEGNSKLGPTRYKHRCLKRSNSLNKVYKGKSTVSVGG